MTAVVTRLAGTAILLATLMARPAPIRAQDGVRAPTDRPNIVVLFADDLGYGDLSSYGNPTVRTPKLDEMAREGIRLTSFYGQPVCTPSRAALLTGRYPIRSGATKVFFPTDTIGLPQSEITLAEALKTRGYRTMAIGKWHLGHLPQFLPTRQGFDHFYGLPYSNDMDRGGNPPIPIMRDSSIVEQPAVQATLTKRYTEEAIRFMKESRDGPFLLYLAYTMPHLPIHVSDEFAGKSRAGLYGDVVEEIDWSAGEVLRTLRELGLDRNTIVIFTSDNGPWTRYPEEIFRKEYGTEPWHTGSSGPLRGSKMGTYEGGVREPAIVRWPGVIPEGLVSADPATNMDLFPTFVHLAGGQLPRDRVIDGRDIMPLLTTGKDTTQRALYYFRGTDLEGVREGRWKLRRTRHLRTDLAATDSITPELFDLDLDPGEHYDVSKRHPDVVARLEKQIRSFAGSVKAHLP